MPIDVELRSQKISVMRERTKFVALKNIIFMSYIKLIHNWKVIFVCVSIRNPESADWILIKFDTSGVVL